MFFNLIDGICQITILFGIFWTTRIFCLLFSFTRIMFLPYCAKKLVLIKKTNIRYHKVKLGNLKQAFRLCENFLITTKNKIYSYRLVVTKFIRYVVGKFFVQYWFTIFLYSRSIYALDFII